MFNKSVWALIGCFLINSVVELFVNIFLTAHMLSLSDNNIAIISQFFIIAYMTLGIGFTVFLPLAKKIKKTILIQIGAVLKTVFLLLVVLLNKTLLMHHVWLAVMYGLIETIFWSGANTAKNKVVESNKIKSLMSVVNINSKVVGIVCPVLFGLSIDAWSFQKIAIVIVCLMVVEIVFSIFIKVPTNEAEKRVTLKQFFCAMKNSPNKKIITSTFIVMFLRGLQFFLPVFLTYLIICLYETNTSLGILTTIASLTAIVLLVVFNLIKNADAKVWPYVLFAILEILAMMLAVVYMNKTFIVIFQIVGICVTLVGDSMVEGLRGSSIREAKLDNFMPQAMAVGELFLNVGRVIGFACLMLIGIFNSFVMMVVMSSVFSLWLMVYFVFLGVLKRDEKRFLYENSQKQEKQQK